MSPLPAGERTSPSAAQLSAPPLPTSTARPITNAVQLDETVYPPAEPWVKHIFFLDILDSFTITEAVRSHAADVIHAVLFPSNYKECFHSYADRRLQARSLGRLAAYLQHGNDRYKTSTESPSPHSSHSGMPNVGELMRMGREKGSLLLVLPYVRAFFSALFTLSPPSTVSTLYQSVATECLLLPLCLKCEVESDANDKRGDTGRTEEGKVSRIWYSSHSHLCIAADARKVADVMKSSGIFSTNTPLQLRDELVEQYHRYTQSRRGLDGMEWEDDKRLLPMLEDRLSFYSEHLYKLDVQVGGDETGGGGVSMIERKLNSVSLDANQVKKSNRRIEARRTTLSGVFSLFGLKPPSLPSHIPQQEEVTAALFRRQPELEQSLRMLSEKVASKCAEKVIEEQGSIVLMQTAMATLCACEVGVIVELHAGVVERAYTSLLRDLRTVEDNLQSKIHLLEAERDRMRTIIQTVQDLILSVAKSESANVVNTILSLSSTQLQRVIFDHTVSSAASLATKKFLAWLDTSAPARLETHTPSLAAVIQVKASGQCAVNQCCMFDCTVLLAKNSQASSSRFSLDSLISSTFACAQSLRIPVSHIQETDEWKKAGHSNNLLSEPLIAVVHASSPFLERLRERLWTKQEMDADVDEKLVESMHLLSKAVASTPKNSAVAKHIHLTVSSLLRQLSLLLISFSHDIGSAKLEVLKTLLFADDVEAWKEPDYLIVLLRSEIAFGRGTLLCGKELFSRQLGRLEEAIENRVVVACLEISDLQVAFIRRSIGSC
uniref:Uncharacterized protein n=1 Tax=Palpitomonas bilix TaxID=652834 RepID=A0A7S3D0T7_9EUKA